MEERWVVSAKKADFNEIGARFGIDPVIARLIRNRDLTEMEEIRQYLTGGREDFYSPWLLKDMKKAVEILKKKTEAHVKIRIIGDYDIDGVTSTCILLKALKRLGAEVDNYIPDRVTDGYGVRFHEIEKAWEDGIDTIVTCDNGIAASNELALAKEKGMTVIVTDHHELPYEEKNGKRVYLLPPADAVINPKQPDCTYPFKSICGAVVAMKLAFALYETYGIPQTEWEEFLELGAIGTVGDVMPLQKENRILVKEGLKLLPYTKNKGLQELIRAVGLDDREITAYHIGFVIGPCINASGRLDTAARSLALLCAETQDEAARLAGDLKALNENRKALTEQWKEKAILQVEENPDKGTKKENRVFVLYLKDCHESLAGIIAGRIREKYNRPTFVLTRSAHGVKGSGRSIEGYSMYDELVKCADLLELFGGHPMAAGLSLAEENVDAFRKRLNENCTLTEEQLKPKIIIDVPMPVSYLREDLVQQLSLLEPFGMGNQKPLFAQANVRVSNIRIVGKNRNVAKMQLSDDTGTVMEAVFFGEAEEFAKYAGSKEVLSVIYYPEINSYQGKEKIQVIIKNYR